LTKLAADGLIYFQDEGSQLAALMLDVKNDERILDVCAGPGGKTTLLASLAPNSTVVAGDRFESRARMIKQFAAQQSAENVATIVHDATLALPFPNGSFDRVLVDAPCSGTGTLRHNPEIRWRLAPSDFGELARKQTLILHNSATMVRPAGLLVYSTCSLETDENETVADDFAQTHHDFDRVELAAPDNLSRVGKAIRTWPHRNDIDGFFITAFRRKN
jgi:16S rRNA (cytosine967-C5)-methyltransferase